MDEFEIEPAEPDQRKTLRRKEDRDRCSICSFIWQAHDKEKDEHREVVCRKLELKADAKLNDQEHEMMQEDIKAKADIGYATGIKSFVSILVTLCCIIVAGMAAWLKIDVGRLDSNIARLHQRLSEKIDYDHSQREKLMETLGSIDKRLAVIEDDKDR